MLATANRKTRLRSSAGRANPKNLDLIESLEKLRLENHWTWDELAELVGVRRPTLLNARKRGTLSDRIASIIRERLGAVRAGAGKGVCQHA